MKEVAPVPDLIRMVRIAEEQGRVDIAKLLRIAALEKIEIEMPDLSDFVTASRDTKQSSRDEVPREWNKFTQGMIAFMTEHIEDLPPYDRTTIEALRKSLLVHSAQALARKNKEPK